MSNPGRVRFCVRDTGEGLSPEKLAQLFQPFNRLGQDASGVAGTGIGLVVTKRLVELMDGSLERVQHGRSRQRVLLRSAGRSAARARYARR